MKKLALVFLLTSSAGWANEAPAVPEGGLQYVYQAPCVDIANGQKGYCHVGVDKEGNYYTTFWQNGELMFIRKAIPGGYEAVWVNSQYDSI